MPHTARDKSEVRSLKSEVSGGFGPVPPARAAKRGDDFGLRTSDPGLVVLGIDPGSVTTGYGLVLAHGMQVEMVDCGAIRPKGANVAERLVALYDRLRDLVNDVRPDEVAIEEPFSRVNVNSAFVLGKAQAVAILAVAHAGRPVFEYTPAAVKQAVTSYGRSGKEQVQEMVRLQFGLATAPQPADAADALAVALCHLAHRRTAAMMQRRG